jgi:hypothetical protein
MNKLPLIKLFSVVFIVLLFVACAPVSSTDREDQSVAQDNDVKYRPIKPSTAEPIIPCVDPQPTFIRTLVTKQEENIPEPVPHTPFRDPIFGGCVVRVTDRQNDLPKEDPSKGLKNAYSRIQSFNADGTLIMVRSLEANYYIYDAMTLDILGALPSMNDPRWSNLYPQLIYDIGELTLMSFNLTNGEHRLIHDFSEDFPDQDIAAVWTRWEGNPSIDDRYWALMAENQDWMTVAFIVYDLAADQIISRKEIHPPEDVDSVTMSPLGNYFLAQFEFCERGAMGREGRPCGLMVYDRNLENARGLLRIVGHSDAALDADGNEIFFYQDIDTDQIAILNLASGKISNLFPIDFTYCDGCGMHFSGLGYQFPGWGLVSYCDGDPITRMWMDDHIFAVELKSGGQAVRFAQHHSMVDPDQNHDYWAEPHASVNRDFSRIVFTSNWGRLGTAEVDMYMIFLPENWHVE